MAVCSEELRCKMLQSISIFIDLKNKEITKVHLV